MTPWLPAVALVAPVLLGAAAGALGLFGQPSRAIDNLNRYALYFAFPALVFRGLVVAEYALPTAPGFWLLIPLVLAVSAAVVRLAFPREAPTLGLIVAFGNVAYLGLPVVERALPEEAMPVAALAVAVHVTLALTVGPLLLLRWSGESASMRSSLSRVARQPLLWAPLIGLLARLLPEPARQALGAVSEPIGQSAAPVALFLLGLYLHTHRGQMAGFEVGDAIHLAVKLGLVPALTFGGAFALHRVGWIDTTQAQVLCLLSAMPAAITTFAIAQQLGVGAHRTSRAIVTTTLAAALVVPAAVWLARQWVPSW